MGERQRLEKLWLKYPTTFRLDSGQGYVGGRKYKAKKDGVIPVKKGDLVVINPGIIKYGIKGAGDRVGWSEKNGIAVFTSIEDKSATDRIGLDQIIFYLNVKLAGGISEVYKEGIQMSHKEIMNMPRRPDKQKKMKEGIIERIEERLKGKENE
ncbi:hypothetical protein KAR91_87100 [Candidatus Pacearchaeota archaeon]|nr:hypothetical protein [Candidatus Pacearchaeota archaeon]